MKIRSFLIVFVVLSLLAYFGTYAFLYSIKEEQSNIFKGQPLPADFKYSFKEDFEEFTIKAPDGGLLNALLFKAANPKGVVCFWKGNGGTLNNWGTMAPQFLKVNYDVMITDYRQQGKSSGKIALENFYADAQTIYNFLRAKYSEENIVIAGYSLGGRIAAHLASENKPKLTILIDAASTTGDFSQRFLEAIYFLLPSTNKFLFQTEADVGKTKTPLAIIATENTKSLSHQLKPLLKPNDNFFEIKGATHATILGDKATEKIIFNLLQ
ncbi:MAG: alpha/beta hydrolase [Adhaeribacter sp.]